MSTENSLVIFTRASQMLAEANTIQKTKELKDLALTAMDWAKRKNMGKEAEEFCKSYALEAERKMGQMLESVELNKGSMGIGKSAVDPHDRTPTLKEMGITKDESSRAQKLSKLDDDVFKATQQSIIPISVATKLASKPKSEQIKIVNDIKSGKTKVTEKSVHISHNSGENEWYTPKHILDAAKEVMDVIDLDPASSLIANKMVDAKKIYTTKEDGLKHKWIGNVWLNPPYSQPAISNFSEKVCLKEYTQICVLVNNATETNWCQDMLKISDCVCFLKTRVRFLDVKGNPSGAPLQGQVIIYIGKNTNKFKTVFSKLGVVLINERQ